MNFQGYPPHLSVLADYAPLWGNYGRFDISWLQKTGADFVFWNNEETAPLDSLTSAGFTLGPVLPLPGGNNLGKLISSQSAPPVRLDLSPDRAGEWPAPMELDGWSVENGVLVKTPGQTNRFGYPVSTVPGDSYDLALDNDIHSGFMTVALGNDVVAQLDANSPRHFSQHMTTSKADDLWIWASADFAGSLSHITVKTAESSIVGFDNGILRVSGSEGAVKSFKTDYTRKVRMEIDSPTSRTVSYLLWPNPYMVLYIDKKRRTWGNDSPGPLSVDIEPGRHRLDIVFESKAGQFFVWAQLAFLVLVAAALVAEIRRRWLGPPGAPQAA